MLVSNEVVQLTIIDDVEKYRRQWTAHVERIK
jgi:hypothetical protein